eukprot:m.502829 g.502829  ORF g.502829 m.502829 type:complete len:331 (-) comp21844_c1_seq4:2764-3756(-)
MPGKEKQASARGIRCMPIESTLLEVNSGRCTTRPSFQVVDMQRSIRQHLHCAYNLLVCAITFGSNHLRSRYSLGRCLAFSLETLFCLVSLCVEGCVRSLLWISTFNTRKQCTRALFLERAYVSNISFSFVRNLQATDNISCCLHLQTMHSTAQKLNFQSIPRPTQDPCVELVCAVSIFQRLHVVRIHVLTGSDHSQASVLMMKNFDFLGEHRQAHHCGCDHVSMRTAACTVCRKENAKLANDPLQPVERCSSRCLATFDAMKHMGDQRHPSVSHYARALDVFNILRWRRQVLYGTNMHIPFVLCILYWTDCGALEASGHIEAAFQEKAIV